MTRKTTSMSTQPSLEDLMVRFLASRSDAATAAVEHGGGEVEPYEVAAGFRVDPRAAWNDATNQLKAAAVQPPPDWSQIVNQSAAVFAMPMAAGNFPQRVRDLQPLLGEFKPAALRPGEAPAPLPGLAGLRNWIAKNAANHPVLAGGLARLIGDFDNAERLLPADAANERAALAWQRGKCEAALKAWNAMPESPAVLFNRGMALLFLGKIAEAKPALNQAIAAIPEASGWNALARLYLAVAGIHG